MAVILTAIVLGIGFVYARLTRRAPAQRGGGEAVAAETAAPFPAPAGIAVGPGGTA
jgi:hypothetical protein